MKFFVFDIGGVLNNTQSKEFKRYFTLKNYYNMDDAKANNLRKELLGDYMKGKIEFKDMIDSMRPYLIDKNKSSLEYENEYKENLRNNSAIFENREGIIKRIKQEGHKVYILSNLTPIDYELFSERFDTSLLDGKFLSYELGLLKPDIAIFDRVIHEIGCDPRSIYFFDDKNDNVNAAKECYINGYVTNGEKLEDDVNNTLKRIKELRL